MRVHFIDLRTPSDEKQEMVDRAQDTIVFVNHARTLAHIYYPGEGGSLYTRAKLGPYLKGASSNLVRRHCLKRFGRWV